MGYYAGGYYAGGYYAGGFLGNLFTGVKGVVGGAIGGFIKGGPIGALTGAAKGTIGAITQNIQSETLGAGGTSTGLTPALQKQHDDALKRGGTPPKPVGTQIIVPPGTGMGLMPMMTGGMVMRGYRLNKSTYVTRGGGTSRWMPGIAIHPKHTELVKSRRMNVANPRALRRALRRAQGFAKLARRFIVVSHRFKKGRKGVRRK
ncbi:MAG TPA: hypothetical protein VK647_15575 [Gemmatimonadales bacterium]|nr:hypothetical protein [Gemmatimonadales bacterium]